ncbi:MAG: tetratricopeptide repeat protein [Myxococcales bacterium]|nr:tetratricopeptide repeat protein [Myxococcales bacterium]MCB9641668.1 tetratricopeptide repeat protein [Myxococcales bacterium]
MCSVFRWFWVLVGLCVWPCWAFSHLGLHDEIASLSRMLRKNPTHVGLLMRRSALYRRHGEMKLAQQDLLKVGQISPHSPRLCLAWGKLWFAMQRWTKAEQSLLCAQKERVPSWQSFWYMARLHRRFSRKKEAIEQYQAALRLRQRPGIYLELGGFWEEQQELEKAAKLYRAGVRSLGGAVTLRMALLRVLRKMGRYREAIVVIEQAMKGLPVRFEWWMRRAEILERLGKKQAALRDRRRALQEVRELLRLRDSSLNREREVRALLVLGHKDEALRRLRLWLRSTPKERTALRLWRRHGPSKAAPQ